MWSNLLIGFGIAWAGLFLATAVIAYRLNTGKSVPSKIGETITILNRVLTEFIGTRHLDIAGFASAYARNPRAFDGSDFKKIITDNNKILYELYADTNDAIKIIKNGGTADTPKVNFNTILKVGLFGIVVINVIYFIS